MSLQLLQEIIIEERRCNAKFRQEIRQDVGEIKAFVAAETARRRQVELWVRRGLTIAGLAIAALGAMLTLIGG